MADDELSAPLGRGTRKTRRRLAPIRLAQAIAGALALFLATFAVWGLVADDPLGGEPVVVVAASADAPSPAAAPAAASKSAQGPRSYDGPGGVAKPQPEGGAPAQRAAPPPGTKTVTIIDGSTGQRQEVAIPAARDAQPATEQRILEDTRYGAIPRVAPDGARPAEVYGRALQPPAGRADAPRVAIVVTGLGVSAALTRQAMDKLPGAVSFAFQPYGPDVERLAADARSRGHEVLLQVPMEPFDYPDNDPGPQTLLTTLTAEQNVDRLHWLMSRFRGYVGITNSMGARFTASETALAPVLRETARRGLIYLDDGASPRSLAGSIASANNVPFAKAEVVLDAVPTPDYIDGALMRLESAAREHGSAVATAAATPATIGRIAQWAKGVEGRGLVLVPITAIALKPKAS